MLALVGKFIRNDSGATAIEYGLIAALMAIACIAAFVAFGGAVNGLFTSVNNKAGNAMNNAGI